MISSKAMFCFVFLFVTPALSASITNVKSNQKNNQLCTVGDPDIDDCLLNMFENTKKYYRKGKPDVGLPPLDPLTFKSIKVTGNVPNLVKIQATISDFTTIGVNDIVFKKVSFDSANSVMYLDVVFPFVQTSMEYDVHGNIVNVSLENKGHWEANATDVIISAKVDLHKIVRNNIEYFKIRSMNIKSTVTDGVLKLVADNPELQGVSDTIVSFFNRDSRFFLDAFNSIYVNTLSDVLTQFLNPIVRKIPIKSFLRLK